MIETINKLIRISRSLVQEIGREPTSEEIAKKMDMPVSKVRKIIKIAQEPISLETPIGEEEDSHLGDFIEDKVMPSPPDTVIHINLREQIEEALKSLTESEAKVLKMRFGLGDGNEHTLEEVGQQFKVTRERIRQIEAKALRKLKHPSRSKKLRRSPTATGADTSGRITLGGNHHFLSSLQRELRSLPPFSRIIPWPSLSPDSLLKWAPQSTSPVLYPPVTHIDTSS